MSVQIQCEHCGAQFKLKDESKLGKRMKCPKCQSPFVAQAADDFGDLDEFEEPPLPKPKKKSSGGKKSKKKGKGKKKSAASPVLPLAIGGGVLGLLLVVGIVWLVVSSLGQRDAAPPAVAEAPVDDAAEGDAADEMDEPADDDAADDEPAPTGGIRTAYLPAETELVLQFSPARILNAPLIKPLLEEEETREFFDEFRKNSGFAIDDIDSITIGIVAKLDDFQFPGPGGIGPMGGGLGGGPEFSEEADFEAEPADPAEAEFADGEEGMQTDGPDDAFSVVTVLRLKKNVQADKLPFLKPDGNAGGKPIYAIQPPTPGGPSPGTDLDGELDPAMEADPAVEFDAEFEGEFGPGGPDMDFGMGPGMMGMTPGADMLTGLVRVLVPDGKTLVFGTKTQLPKLKKSEAPLADRFAFITEQSGFVLAASLDFVPSLKSQFDQQAAMLPPEARKSARELFDFYDKGARGVYFSVDVTDGASLSMGVGGADADAASALRDELQQWINEFRDGIEDELSGLPAGLQEIVRETVTALDPQQEESVVTVAATVNAQQIKALQEQAEQLAGQMMMAALMGGSPFGGLGEGIFPGMPGGPGSQKRSVSGEPQAPLSVEGLPEGIELTAVAGWTLPGQAPGGWPLDAMEQLQQMEQRPERSEFDLSDDAAMPNEAEMRRKLETLNEEMAQAMGGGSDDGGPVIAIDLLLGGTRGEQVVQFKQVRLHEAVTADGESLKQRRIAPVPYASPDGWSATESVLVEDTFADQLSIPVQFDPPGGEATAVSAFSGEAVVRIAADVEELTVDVASLSGDGSQLEAAGIRVRPLPDAAVPSVYIGPANENVEILEVSPAAAMPQGLAGGGPGIGSGFGGGAGGTGSGGRGQSGSAVQNFAEMQADAAEMEFDDPAEYEDGAGRGRRQTMGESITVSRPQHWNPQGFVVALAQSGGVKIRIARGFEEQKIDFTFEDLPVAPLDPSHGAPEQPWVEIADRDSLPEGITGVFARGTWEPSSGDDRRMTFNVAIDVIGPAATNLVSLGVFQLDECTADDGKRLNLSESHPAVKDRVRGLHRQDPQLWGTDMPPDGFRVHFPLSAIEPTFQNLSSLKGSFRFRYASGREEVVVPELGQFVGKRVLHDALLEERVALALARETDEEPDAPRQSANDAADDEFETPQPTRRQPSEGPALVVSFPGRDRDKIVAIDLTDAEGTVDPSIPKEVKEKGNSQEYRFRIGQRNIGQLGLRVVLNRDLQPAVRLPFHFENLPAPRMDETPEQ
jgi:hypothetical protein